MFARQNAPAGQLEHTDADVAPLALLHVPAWHGCGADARSVQKKPAGHCAHVLLPPAENEPDAQFEHVEADVAPDDAENVPASHCEHTLLPAVAENEPGTHDTHTDDDAAADCALKVPIEHGVHT